MASHDGDPSYQGRPSRALADQARPCVSGRVPKARPDCCDYSAKLVARSLFAGVSERLSRREVLWGDDARKVESIAAFRRTSRRLGTFTVDRRDRSSSCSKGSDSFWTRSYSIIGLADRSLWRTY